MPRPQEGGRRLPRELKLPLWATPLNWEHSDFEFELLNYFFILCFLVCFLSFPPNSWLQFLGGDWRVSGLLVKQRCPPNAELGVLAVTSESPVGLTGVSNIHARLPWLHETELEGSRTCIWGFSN